MLFSSIAVLRCMAYEAENIRYAYDACESVRRRLCKLYAYQSE